MDAMEIKGFTAPDGNEYLYKDETARAYARETQGLVENTPYCEYEDGDIGDMELPIHTIDDDVISELSTYSSQKMHETFCDESEVNEAAKQNLAKALEVKESKMIGIKNPSVGYVSEVKCTNRYNNFCACVYGSITLSADLPAGESVNFAAENSSYPGCFPKIFRASSVTRWGKTVAIVEVATNGDVTLKNPTNTPLSAGNAIPFRVDYMAI